MKRFAVLLFALTACFSARAEYLGEFYLGQTIPIIFTTYDADGASVTISGLAVTDIEVYKGTSMTQRASDSGYALIDGDGIDIDSTVGVHGASLNTSDNTTAGFWEAGSPYTVLINSIVVESETVVGRFTFNLKTGDMFVTDNDEPTAPPAADAPLADKIAWLFALARNRLTQEAAGDQCLYADDGVTEIGCAPTSDNGMVTDRGEFAP